MKSRFLLSLSMILGLLFLAASIAAQTLPAPNVATPPKPEADVNYPAKRQVYEAVVGHLGKPIGTNIMLEVTDDGAVRGWIQRNDFFPIDSGTADSERIKFTSSGNQYDINLRTGRINYSGPDGQGNQRVERMTRVEGMIYRLTEPAMGEGQITIRNEDGERDYMVGRPAIWKREGPPIDRLDFDRLKEVLGKTTGAYLARYGGTRYLAVLEEPAGMDLQKKAPKEKDKKRK